MPDNDQVVAEFEKNGRELIRVRLTEFRGVELVDVRAFYQDPPGSEEWKPGKGLALKRELLPELIAGLQEAERADQEARKKRRGKNRPTEAPTSDETVISEQSDV